MSNGIDMKTTLQSESAWPHWMTKGQLGRRKAYNFSKIGGRLINVSGVLAAELTIDTSEGYFNDNDRDVGKRTITHINEPQIKALRDFLTKLLDIAAEERNERN